MPSTTLQSEIEGSMFADVLVCAVLFGIYTVLYAFSIYFLKSKRRARPFQRRFYIAFGGLLWLLHIAGFASNAASYRSMWVLHPPASSVDPLAYYETMSQTLSSVILGDLTQAFAVFFADALMLWRCYVILGHKIWVICLPFLLWLSYGAISMTSFMISLTNQTASHPLTHFQQYTAAATTALNLFLTATILAQLLSTRRRIRPFGVPSSVLETYTGPAALVIESAAIACVFSVAMLVVEFVGTDSKTAQMANGVVRQFWYFSQSIAAELIIIRIATGSGWSGQTVFELDRPSAYPTTIFAGTTMGMAEMDITLDLAAGAGIGAGAVADRLLKHSRDDSDSVRSV